jgi:phosphate starvation-inducible PhoH-like protein
VNISNVLSDELDALGIIGTNSLTKFIPDKYLCGDINQRLALLQGLMDTDGSIYSDHTHIKESSVCHYYTISQSLCDGVVFLVQSLGGTAKIKERKIAGLVDKFNRKYNHNCFDISIRLPQNLNPFRLPRKRNLFLVKEKPVRLITSISVEREVFTQCIAVDAPNHLYITDNCIVTHNTFVNSFIIVDEAQNVTHSQMEAILGRLGKESKMVVCGDTAQIDLRDKKTSGFSFLARIEEHVPGFKVFALLQNHRHKIVAPILEVYKTFSD